MFDGSQFVLKPTHKYSLRTNDSNERQYEISRIDGNIGGVKKVKLAYIAPETPSRVLENRYFSSKSGSESELKTLRNLRWGVNKKHDGKRPIDDYTIRGNYAGYLGVVEDDVDPNTIYTIYNASYIGDSPNKRKTQVEVRALDSSPFTAISQRTPLNFKEERIAVKEDVYGGDCFSCTTSIKMCYNFLDYSTPLNDKVVKQNIKPNDAGNS